VIPLVRGQIDDWARSLIEDGFRNVYYGLARFGYAIGQILFAADVLLVVGMLTKPNFEQNQRYHTTY
jgi:uncharacterized membrane protein